ncbi:class I SAM-dependent methyltransferase [Candidatus Sumerlaeota bacterium]|nr:class I SAM-dependent methyltransferase [Candidatus Sumerlaeota bacterium]
MTDHDQQHSADGQREYWDANLDVRNLGGEVDFDLDVESAFLQAPDHRQAWEWMGDLKGRRALEIGCGLGVHAIWLAHRGARVVALDSSYERLIALRRVLEGQNYPGKIWLVQAGAEQLPFADDAFDIEYCKAVLIHTELDRSLPEINRTLKPDGRGVFIEPLRRNPFVKLYRNTFAPKIWKSIARYFGPQETGLMQKYFGHVQWRDFYFTAFAAFVFQFALRSPVLFRIAISIFHPFDRLLIKLPVFREMNWMRAFCVKSK